MQKQIKRKDKEVQDFLDSVDYSSTPLLLDLLDKHTLFFDDELKVFCKCVDFLHTVVKNVRRRFDRRATLQIAPSVARYMELNNQIQRYPHLLYSFTAKDVRICIAKIKGKYCICCINYDIKSSHLVHSRYLQPSYDDHRIYGSFDKLDSQVLNAWLDVVFEFCSKQLEVLF